MKVILTQEKLQELNNFIQEMPTKYGLPLLKFFETLIEDQNKKEEKK